MTTHAKYMSIYQSAHLPFKHDMLNGRGESFEVLSNKRSSHVTVLFISYYLFGGRTDTGENFSRKFVEDHVMTSYVYTRLTTSTGEILVKSTSFR